MTSEAASAFTGAASASLGIFSTSTRVASAWDTVSASTSTGQPRPGPRWQLQLLQRRVQPRTLGQPQPLQGQIQQLQEQPLPGTWKQL